MVNPIKLLSDQEVAQITAEAAALLDQPGLKIDHQAALQHLQEAGCQVNDHTGAVQIPPDLVERSISSCPATFSLYDFMGQETIRYGGDQTHFNPGSSALSVLDTHTSRIRPALSEDFSRFVQLVEVLPAIDAQSTAMVCSDVVEEIQDLYRLYIALNYQTKPIVTGVFRHQSWAAMREMLITAVGGSRQLRQKPPAIFDICPTSPLQWSYSSCQNLIDNVQVGIPVQIISMPMAGATAPVTLAGTLVQHTAECLSGLVISQIISPGAPVVWGGSAAVFDMKHSLALMGAPGTWLLACAYAQVGRALGVPTQGYLGLSDAKILDAQAGMESAAGALLGMLAGFQMISGAGMLAHENCQSPEKLILDAEMIGQLKHFARGIQFRDQPAGLDLIRKDAHQGDFISQEHTYQWFKEVVQYSSPVIDRQPVKEWEHNGSQDAWQRARRWGERLLDDYPGPALDASIRAELRRITAREANSAGQPELPALPE